MKAKVNEIKRARFNCGWTQAELAEKAGVSLVTINNAEKGNSISAHTNRAIRNALKLN